MNVSVMIILVGYIKINKMNKMNKMKRGSRRNMSLGLLLLVVTLVCVVSHKFREGMDQKEVKKRLDKMEDKLDDIYEEVVGEGEERIKTGKYVAYHVRLNEYEERIYAILTNKGGNKYHLSSLDKFNYDLELLSDNSLFGRNVSTKGTTVVTFGKGEYLFIWDKALYVHEDYKSIFIKEMEKQMTDKDDKWYLYFFNNKLIDNEAIKREKEERKKV